MVGQRSSAALPVINPGQSMPEPVRECGSCTACCTWMRVPEIDKGAGVECQHVCADGCSIYEGRPTACSSWSCMWALGGLREQQRPDKTGLIFWPADARARKTWGADYMIGRETTRAASKMRKGEKVLRQITKSGVSVMLIQPDGIRHMIAGDGKSMFIQLRLRKFGLEYTRNGNRFTISRESCMRVWPDDFKDAEERT